MKGKLLILLLSALIPVLIFAAKKHPHTKYKYKYRFHLKDQPSSYSLLEKDSDLNGNSLIQFTGKGSLGTIPIIHIHDNSSKSDTALYYDTDSSLSLYIASGTYKISISSLLTTPLSIEEKSFKPNTKYVFTTLLGKYNALSIAIVHSKKKLSKQELELLIDDLSFDRGENALITQKICLISWEI